MIRPPIKQVKQAVLIMGVVVIIFVFNAIFKDYISYRVNLVELEINQKKLTNLEHQHTGLIRQLEIFNRDKQKLKSMLFNENGLANFLKSMPQAASNSGVKVLRMSAERNFKEVIETYPPGHINTGIKEKSQPELMELPIRTTIEGTLSSVENFLIDLEQYKQLLSVKNVSITTKKYPVMEGEFTLTAFIIKEGQ